MKLIDVILILFAVFIIMTTFACAQPLHISEDGSYRIDDVTIHKKLSGLVISGIIPVEIGSVGRGIGFVRREDIDKYQLERPQNYEFQIDEGNHFVPYLILTNGTKDDKVFIITAILDYKQVPFELDGKFGLLHEVTTPANTELNIPLSLDIQGPGAHDIQIIGFDDPYNVNLDIDYRSDLFGHITSRRTVAIVGGQDNPAQLIQYKSEGTPVPAEVTFTAPLYFASMPSLEDAHPSTRQMYVTTAESNSQFKFQTILNNMQEQVANYMLVAFLDYHQIEILDKNTIAISLNPMEEVIIDSQIQIPPKQGIRLFQMIRVFDPYRSILRNEVTSRIVFGSPRIAIVSR